MELTHLIERSEQRIDITNDMINKLTSVISNLTITYDNHLKQLEESRNEIIKQNTKLIELVAEEKKSYNDVLSMQERLTSALINSHRINFGDVGCGNQ